MVSGDRMVLSMGLAILSLSMINVAALRSGPRPLQRLTSLKSAASPAAPWYEGGVQFECTGCGDCCRVEGDVWLNPDEARELAAAVEATPAQFDIAYTDAALGGGWRRLKSTAAGCVLLTPDGKCGAHAARPVQCRAYPFWPRLLASREAMTREASVCEGIFTGEVVVPSTAVERDAAEWAAWLRRYPATEAAQVENAARWATAVAEIGLCPWARKSLEERAVRYVHTSASSEAEVAEALVLAAAELFASPADDATAILFLVAPALHADDFAEFFGFAEELEDGVFADAPPLSKHAECLADDVQLAAFHPLWTFAGLEADDPLHFEKRAPHPTFSLVRARAISDAEMATANVSETNERTLATMDPKDLQRRLVSP